MKPEILQIAPMLPRVEAALAAAYAVHRYWEAADKPALLAAVGPRIRAVATDGHYGDRARDHGGAAGARDRRELRRRLRRDRHRRLQGARRAGDEHPRRPQRRRGRARPRPDASRSCRRIPQADAFVRAGRWADGESFGLTGELTGAHVGILGLGRIGKEIARRLQAMKMRVSYHGRHAQPAEPYVYYPDLVAMARDVDWLVVDRPRLRRDPRHRLARRCSRRSGPEGAIVNVARGSLVDEPAMVELLVSRRARRRRPRRLRRRAARARGALRACRTSSSRRTRARRPARPAPRWATSSCGTSPPTSPATRSRPRWCRSAARRPDPGREARPGPSSCQKYPPRRVPGRRPRCRRRPSGGRHEGARTTVTIW